MKKKNYGRLTPAKVQPYFNKYIRARDSEDGYFTCISCSRTLSISDMNAGHYVPVGRCSALRFDEYNVNGECQRCNAFDEFHLIGYRKNLIEKIGVEMVNWIEEHSRDLKQWKQNELKEIKEKYKSIENIG